VTAQAQDTAGTYSLTVEYAGAAPGFFGLDQVNLVLPPDLDRAGTVSLSLAADGSAANVVTFQMNAMAQSAATGHAHAFARLSECGRQRGFDRRAQRRGARGRLSGGVAQQ
jgi:hypothetical protein